MAHRECSVTGTSYDDKNLLENICIAAAVFSQKKCCLLRSRSHVAITLVFSLFIPGKTFVEVLDEMDLIIEQVQILPSWLIKIPL